MLRIVEPSFKDTGAGILLRKRDINSFLESPTDSLVKLPWCISGAKHKNTIHVVVDALHLNKKLCLYSPGGIIFSFSAAAAHRVDLINENDARLALTCHLEKLFYSAL